MKVAKTSFADRAVLLFIGLYPISPGYFKILGFDSALILVFIIFVLYMLAYEMKIKLSTKLMKLMFLLLILRVLPMLIHFEMDKIVRSVIERFMLVIILCAYMDTDEKVENVINCLLTVCFLLCMVGIFEFLTGYNIFTLLLNTNETYNVGPDLQYRGGMARIETAFGHSISYSIYLSFCGIFSIFFYYKYRQRKYLIGYLLIWLNMILTISRAPLVIFLASQILMIFKMGYKKILNLLIGFILLFFASLLFFYVMLPQVYHAIINIFLIIAAIFNPDLAIASTMSISNPFLYRLELLNTIPMYMKGHYLSGIGSQAVEHLTFRMLGGFTYYSIDNYYLSAMLKYGAVGLAGVILGILCPVILILKVKNRNLSQGLCLDDCLVMISLVYLLNLCSVAEMSEYKIWLVITSIIFAVYSNKTRKG